MILEGAVLLVTAITTLLLTVLVLSYYLPRLRRLSSEIKEASEIVESIMIELRNRMNSQDKKIMDQEVKLEILELRIAKLLQPAPREFSAHLKSVKAGEERLQKAKETSNREVVSMKGRLTETEKEILENLSQRGYTARELQSVINKTREHTSRTLKKLFEDGYIERDERKKPFVYRLVKKGTFTSL